jgi:hypothetical protein
MIAGRIVADGAPPDILAQRDLLKECRLVPTSLLDENLKYFPQTGRFLSAEALARVISPAALTPPPLPLGEGLKQ